MRYINKFSYRIDFNNDKYKEGEGTTDTPESDSFNSEVDWLIKLIKKEVGVTESDKSSVKGIEFKIKFDQPTD